MSLTAGKVDWPKGATVTSNGKASSIESSHWVGAVSCDVRVTLAAPLVRQGD